MTRQDPARVRFPNVVIYGVGIVAEHQSGWVRGQLFKPCCDVKAIGPEVVKPYDVKPIDCRDLIAKHSDPRVGCQGSDLICYFRLRPADALVVVPENSKSTAAAHRQM